MQKLLTSARITEVGDVAERLAVLFKKPFEKGGKTQRGEK